MAAIVPKYSTLWWDRRDRRVRRFSVLMRVPGLIRLYSTLRPRQPWPYGLSVHTARVGILLQTPRCGRRAASTPARERPSQSGQVERA